MFRIGKINRARRDVLARRLAKYPKVKAPYGLATFLIKRKRPVEIKYGRMVGKGRGYRYFAKVGGRKLTATSPRELGGFIKSRGYTVLYPTPRARRRAVSVLRRKYGLRI
jgi:hypothetical protein